MAELHMDSSSGRLLPMTAAAGALTLLLGLLLSCSATRSRDPQLYAVHVERLMLDDRTESPVLLLKETHGAGRELPIWIGMTEAQSIAMAMEDMVLPRPNTHDLIKNLLDGLHGDIRRVVITELRGHTYYAVIEIGLNGREVAVDSRPSDAIAVAIRTGAPLFATDSVLVRAVDEDQGPALDIDWRNVLAPRQSETLSPV